MNFLQICQRLNREAGLSGTGPAAVTSQSGMSRKVVDWANSAWEAIQAQRTDWKWRRISASGLSLTSGDYDYSIEDDFSLAAESIFLDSVRLHAATGETIANRTKVIHVDYQDWLDNYEQLTASTGRPMYFTITPADAMLFSPTPDATYTLLFDYLRAPQELAQTTDEPIMPSQYHMLIVWRALMMYAAHDESPQYQTALLEHKRLMRSMMKTQLAPITDLEPML